MKLIKLLRNIFNDNKNNERKLSDKRFNVIIKNKIKNYNHNKFKCINRR